MKINFFIIISLLSLVFLLGACNNTNRSESINNRDEIKIGVQTWAIANLNVTHFRNGDTIPEAKTAKEWEKAGDGAIPAWCYYNNEAANGEKYGKLYNWFTVNDKRGLAPNGWHIPDDDEWTKLIEYSGGRDSAGIKMKSSGGWNDNGNGTNTTDFSGFPGGYRYNNGAFNGIGKFGSWWSTTAFETGGAWYRYLTSNNGVITRKFDDIRDGFSVRCLKD